MTAPRIAHFPITWPHFQDLMRELGFEMVAHNNEATGVIFQATADKVERQHGMKSPVTILYPTYVSSDGITPAFERDYVVDLLLQMSGNGDTDAIFTMIAKRHFHG